MLINIRGTNGSGKSTIAKSFLSRFGYQALYGASGPKRPEAYRVPLLDRSSDVYVIGPYQTNTGGVDALGLRIEELIPLLDKYRTKGHVIFEGIVLSTTFGAIGEWLVQHKDEAIVVYLDTSLKVCLQSLEDRNGGTPKGTKNVADKFKSITATLPKFDAAGIRTETLPRETAFETILGWLK